MGQMIELEAADGHRFAAYEAEPRGTPKGGLVIIQEIFGLTDQMKRTGDRFAEAGYLAVVPAMFDRVERGATFAYSDVQNAFAVIKEMHQENTLSDLEAAEAEARKGGRTAIMGYCWGGTMAFLGAARLRFDCAVSYYGGGVEKLIDEMKPRVPVLYHFGEKDGHIPLSTAESIREKDPTGIVHVYEGADHGFCCDDRASFHAAACELSEKRTLEFLARHLGG
jgi:carboxymethylenebutenolidase